MDTTALVAWEIDEGRRILDHLVGADIPVRAACWIKRQDRSEPSLYIASPLVERDGFTDAYRRVLGTIRSLGELRLNAPDISLVGENDPLVGDVRSVRQQRREGLTLSDLGTFGRFAIDAVYVYPPSEAFVGFNQLKQRFPSTEVFVIDLPGDPALPANWCFHPAIASLVMKVNATEFEGKAVETLLFVGPTMSRPDDIKQLKFAHRPEGWNSLYDRKTKGWKRVVFEGTNQPVYEPADFAPLLELKSPLTAGG